MNALREKLRRIDGRGYKAYKEIRGRYDFGRFRLWVDHVQGDPFAAPSRICVRIEAGLNPPPEAYGTSPVRRMAAEDFLGRAVNRAIRRHVRGNRGSGKSGRIGICTGGQEMLERNAVRIFPEAVEARLTMGLPAAGRTVLGREAAAMFFDEIPRIVDDALFFGNLPAPELARHVDAAEDHEALRAWLAAEGLAAFVADGSLLPRRSGVDDRPLGEGAVGFRSPDTLAREVSLPHAGRVRGLGIPAGVTLIVGGGFHGKSTLLHALERGVYPHIPGDGRELVATEPTAVKIRAEDGRAVNRVDIRPFIDNLPFGRDTRAFTTSNASGSTSQAANIVEALETGCRLMLIDEDTSATNFMIRDERMQRLIARDKEPITPLLHRVRELYERRGVSSIIVMGGSGDYFDVADTVIMMDNYEPRDVTAEARRLARPAPAGSLPPWPEPAPRRPDLSGVHPGRGRREVKIEARGVDGIAFGRFEIDLGRVEQLVDPAQTRAAGLILHRFLEELRSGRVGPGPEGLRRVYDEVRARGLDELLPYRTGDLALPRLHEVAAALNRIRQA